MSDQDAREKQKQQFRNRFPDIAAIVDELRKTEAKWQGRVMREADPNSVKVICIKDLDGNILAGKEPPPDPDSFTMSAESLARLDSFYSLMKIKPVEITERPRYGKRF